MKKQVWRLIVAMSLAGFVPAGPCFAQYIDIAYDMDSSNAFGMDIVLNPDQSIFIFGGGVKYWQGVYRREWMIVNADGQTLQNEMHLTDAPWSSYTQQAGGRLLYDSLFISPFIQQLYNGSDSLRTKTGFIGVNTASGSLRFAKAQTDTAFYQAQLLGCAITPEKQIIGGGKCWTNDLNSIEEAHPLLIKADANGDTIWTKRYPQFGQIWSVACLEDGRIVTGNSTNFFNYTHYHYHFRPYFQYLDSNGQVLYTKYLDSKFISGGRFIKDQAGGFLHWGKYDSLVIDSGHVNDYLDFRNFPGYVTQLDDSFNTVWHHLFWDTSLHDFHLFVQNVVQLHDSNYLVLGTWQQYGDIGSYQAYVGKLSHATGEILWEQKLHQDTGTYPCYLIDAVEKPDGSILLAGEARDAFAPEWRQQDFWLVGLDSNGCPVANCSPATGVGPKVAGTEAVRVYPNPTTGQLTISSAKAGSLELYTVDGRRIGSFPVSVGDTHLVFPSGAAPGIYVGRVQFADGTAHTLRIAYQP